MTTSEPDMRRRRVLIVDDNADITTAMQILLDALGQDVAIANSGPAALELARVYKPELVFLDLGLPAMDGYTVARALRQQPDGDKLVIIALSGWGDAASRQKSTEAGVDQHWLKPVAVDELTAYLTSEYARSVAT